MSSPSMPALRSALRSMRPDASIINITPIEAGKNAVYTVSYDDLNAILKVGTASDARVLTEPEVLRVVRSHTAIPVPEVLGTSRDLLEYPCCLYEQIPGQTVPDRPVIESPELLVQLCTEAGRYLADLHSIEVFEQCGPLVLGPDGLRAAAVADDWPSAFQQTLEANIDQLGSRFAPYVEALSEYASEAATKCQSATPVTPVLAHMDYRPANLVIDPDADRVTRGVVDWAGAAATPAAYELAHAEALLTEWPASVVEQATLLEQFREAYAEQRELPVIPDIYRVDARLRLMNHLDMETKNLADTTADARAEDHLASLDALGALQAS